jgi:hypothetical protein
MAALEEHCERRLWVAKRLFEIPPIGVIQAVVLPSCTKHNLVMDTIAKLPAIAVSTAVIFG